MHYIEYSRYYFAYAYKFFRTFFKIQKQLENPQAVIDENILIDLVSALRPSDPQDTDEIEQKIQAFIDSLLLTPTAPALLQTFYYASLINISKSAYMQIAVFCL